MNLPSSHCAGRIVLVGFLSMAAAPLSAQRPSDGEIEAHIMTSLLVDPHLSPATIDVAVADGFVTLEGRVGSLATRSFAVEEAEKIAGVKGVTDHLEICAPVRSDFDITQDIRHRLLDHSRISAFDIGVHCERGTVTLSGEVPAEIERQLATELAGEVRGVRDVVNHMTVDYGWTRGDEDIQKDVQDALALDVFLCGLPVEATVDNGIVRLEGAVRSGYARRRAEQDVIRLPGVREVADDLQVRWSDTEGERRADPVVDDGMLAHNVERQLRHDSRLDASKLQVAALAGEISLLGSVPTAYEKNLALEDARDTIGVAWVSDFVQVRDEPRADDAVRADVMRGYGFDDRLGDAGLNAEVDHGVVTVTGTLGTPFLRRHAVELAYRVRGVRRVVDEIHVIATSMADRAIERAVSERLRWDWRTSTVGADIAIEVTDGTVTLSGTVPHWAQREAAGRIARETPGVAKVFDHLAVAKAPYDWETWFEMPLPSWDLRDR